MYKIQVLSKLLAKLIANSEFTEAFKVYEELGKVLDTYKISC